MNRESVAKLKLDRRLSNRRGWISKEELDGALEALPDAARKATRLGQEEQGEDSESEPSGTAG